MSSSSSSSSSSGETSGASKDSYIVGSWIREYIPSKGCGDEKEYPLIIELPRAAGIPEALDPFSGGAINREGLNEFIVRGPLTEMARRLDWRVVGDGRNREAIVSRLLNSFAPFSSKRRKLHALQDLVDPNDNFQSPVVSTRTKQGCVVDDRIGGCYDIGVFKLDKRRRLEAQEEIRRRATSDVDAEIMLEKWIETQMQDSRVLDGKTSLSMVWRTSMYERGLMGAIPGTKRSFDDVNIRDSTLLGTFRQLKMDAQALVLIDLKVSQRNPRPIQLVAFDGNYFAVAILDVFGYITLEKMANGEVGFSEQSWEVFEKQQMARREYVNRKGTGLMKRVREFTREMLERRLRNLDEVVLGDHVVGRMHYDSDPRPWCPEGTRGSWQPDARVFVEGLLDMFAGRSVAKCFSVEYVQKMMAEYEESLRRDAEEFKKKMI